jgi:hypothetical protein
MSRMTIQTDLGRISDLPTLIKYTAQCIQQLNNIINGNVEFGDNIMSQIVSVVFNTANVGQYITHGMRSKGLKFFVVDKSVSCDVFHTASLDNDSQIYLTCTVATTVTIILI